MALDWLRSDKSPLVFPAPPPEPPKREPQRYLLVCPRCCQPAEIGEQITSRYAFSCPCGGGWVETGGIVMGDRHNDVLSIAWNKPAPLLGARPL